MRPAISRPQRLVCAMAIVVGRRQQPVLRATPGRDGSVRPAARPQRPGVLAAVDRAGRRLHRADARPRSRSSSTGSAITSCGPRRTASSTRPRASRSPTSRRRSKTAGIDNRNGEFNDWTLLDGRRARRACSRSPTSPATRVPGLHVQELRLHLRRTCLLPAAGEGSSARRRCGYRRLIDMRELDDCGAIGAALDQGVREEAGPALPGRHRPRRPTHILHEAAAPARRHARAAAAVSRSRSGSTTPT